MTTVTDVQPGHTQSTRFGSLDHQHCGQPGHEARATTKTRAPLVSDTRLLEPFPDDSRAGMDADESGDVLPNVLELMRRVGRGDRHVARARLPGFLSDPDLHPRLVRLGEGPD